MEKGKFSVKYTENKTLAKEAFNQAIKGTEYDGSRSSLEEIAKKILGQEPLSDEGKLARDYIQSLDDWRKNHI